MTARKWFLALATPLLLASAEAEVRLPHVFGSHMVLQRDVELPVWGWGDPGESVTVQLGEQAAVKATANDAGRWEARLAATPAGGPSTLTVKGSSEVVLDDVPIGEVWLCSGQSNMAMVVASCINRDEEIAAAQDSQIRHITIPRVPASLPVDDVTAEWLVCSPETAGGFTAAGYFMARELRRELNVPVGLVNSSWGGTRIEPWTPPVGFEGIEEVADVHQRVLLADPRTDAYKTRLGEYLTELDTWTGTAREALPAEAILEAAPVYPPELLPMTTQGHPSALHNGMVHPLIPFAVRGAIWYQGEANHREGMLYYHKTRALIGGWRKLWGQGDFPFYYVQIAPWPYGTESTHYLAEFWEAQAAALAIPATGMVVTTDIGDLADIHPKNKQEVGRRLALLALNGTYGRDDVVASGPTLRSMDIEEGRLRLHFDNLGGGLASRDGQPLDWFQVVGEDTDFVDATAEIDGDTVVLSSPEVTKPVAMRFAWSKLAEPNFQNKAGLPAAPFRAGEVPTRDWLKLKVAESDGYTLVYDLDLHKLGLEVTYDVDDRARVTGPFDRVAYFLELQAGDGPTEWVYVSIDAFTDDLGKIGVPTLSSGAEFQTKVAGATVISNVEGITAGELMGGCNIEFWPHNYGPTNNAGIPGASGTLWDFGDQYGPPVDGYGCMQVHNWEAKHTIFAINRWKGGNGADIGIGNSTADPRTRDWTFSNSGAQYTTKRLRVLVRPKQ